VSRPTQDTTKIVNSYVYRSFTFYGSAFQKILLGIYALYCGPTTPTLPKQYWFRLIPFRSPLLRESLLFSFPPGTKMFQFPGFASNIIGYPIAQVGFPIRKSADQFVFANPRSLSQLITSFFASKSQGIPRTPFSNFLSPFLFVRIAPSFTRFSYNYYSAYFLSSMSKNFSHTRVELQILRESNPKFKSPDKPFSNERIKE
jgi:hypothetical protein